MTRTFLIDGYNLIHALGMIQKQLDAGGLEASRRRLLDFLAAAFKHLAPQVTIVFDAKHAPRGLPREQEHLELRVQFAPAAQSADDWIETLIAQEPSPAGLVVVSNEQRLREAARGRGARAWSDQDLLDFFEQANVNVIAKEPPTEERGAEMTDAEKEHWRREFGPLEDDPRLKEFFDLDRFD
jgi:predicted RNA-binding protein with PIN domain